MSDSLDRSKSQFGHDNSRKTMLHTQIQYVQNQAKSQDYVICSNVTLTSADSGKVFRLNDALNSYTVSVNSTVVGSHYTLFLDDLQLYQNNKILSFHFLNGARQKGVAFFGRDGSTVTSFNGYNAMTFNDHDQGDMIEITYIGNNLYVTKVIADDNTFVVHNTDEDPYA